MPNTSPLRASLAAAKSGILLLSLTPPRRSSTPGRVAEIARVTRDRLDRLDLDGLILYDIDDESDRNEEERPFPYLPTMDPAEFYREHLRDSRYPAVIYRCVGKYAEEEFTTWLKSADTDRVVSVFVGPSSGQKAVRTTLSRAHALRTEVRPGLLVGGVCISERHTRSGDEHLRMLAKQDRGCAFFISQVVYNVDAVKTMLSDYYYACRDRGETPRPVVLTLSVCGSMKTLSFLQWLGVNVPGWMINTLDHAEDPLAESYEQCVANARDLTAFCRRLGIPFGFNVESVSIRKVEIDAAVTLAADVRAILKG
ncbi:5,10-methylenetetrahydrofolate reductase [Micromonospora sp. LOL_024]|uniref:5,10-methylenetetrahydrofolate reductase n=1 Tax=Micromonospora sp. LOL_024 TaxID=3345412 RepID=UPI003A8610CC